MNNNNSIHSIQLLRTIAALSVVYTHYAFYAVPNFVTGAFGVDIFFIISGFIIAYIVSRNVERFLLKRIIRIVPLYVIATSVTILSTLLYPQSVNNISITITAIIKSLLFIPYRINNSGPILSLGWSLNYEMFFYLAMFVCICVIRNNKYFTIACSVLLILFSICINGIQSNHYFVLFFQNGIILEFIYGILIYHIYNKFILQRNIKQHNITTNRIKIISLSLIAILSFLFLLCDVKYRLHLSNYRNIQTGLPALLLVTSILFLEPYINSQNRIIKLGLLLGDASYVIYLFHPFCIFFLQRIIYPRLGSLNHLFIVEIVKCIIAFVLTNTVCIYIYKWIDNPIQIRLRSWMLK